MKTFTLWLVVCVLAGLILAGGVAGALPAAPEAPEADVATKINYQGRLTSAAGVPLNGTYTMRFQIYGAATGGTLLWDSGNRSISVAGGLFNAELAVDAPDVNGAALWLQITVNGETLTPRQELLPVPYALSLRPGAEIKGQPSAAGSVVRAEMAGTHTTQAAMWGYASTGDAVRGTSAGGYGVAGYTDDGYAIYGRDAGSSTARGYGGYFTSQNGVGVYGFSDAAIHYTNQYAPGVYGRSTNGTGVYGAGRTGVRGDSESYHGMYARTGNVSNNYGLYTPDNIYSLNFHTAGALMQLAQNGGSEALEPGDVVVFSGMAAALEAGGPPVIQVARSATAASPAVAGVVYSRFNVATVAEERQAMDGEVEATPPGPVPPGEYLLVVVQGPAQVKVDAALGALRPGDLVGSAAQAAHAGRAAEVSAGGVRSPAPGTILGKALEPWDGGSGRIYVFVTLQ